MWQTKYALAVPKNLGVGADFRPFPHQASLVSGTYVPQKYLDRLHYDSWNILGS